MIGFERFRLENGLRVIVHHDNTTPLVTVNLLYDVGARDEQPEKTGFAHLFEHLMFGGSKNIANFDTPVQISGGENNAFTSNDITNYYIILPKENIETAFWLESDRMLCLDFSERSLEVQRSVVIEEFRQRYLNQPYGDASLLLRPLAYKEHPYQWPTIGKDISHIESATLGEVENFFFTHYAPNNAILCVTGDIETDEVRRLAQKWFGSIETRNVPLRNLPQEPEQTEARSLEVERKVPFDALYKAFHTCKRNDPEFYASDLICDILSVGKSSRLYRTLVQEKKLFSEFTMYMTGDLDPGLLYFSGKLIKGVSMQKAEKALQTELEKLCKEPVSVTELEKVKNKVETTQTIGNVQCLNKAVDLAWFELMGDANLINQESEKYRAVTPEMIQTTATKLLSPVNCSTLYYKAKSEK